MKRFGIILLGLLCSMPLLAQSVQSGLVLEYNGSQQKTPLSKVVIATGNAPIVTSDDQGQFTLSFRTLHAGDAIQFRRVELSGYEVMNTEALEAARVARVNLNDNLLRPQDARTEGSNPNSLNVKPSTLNIVMIKRETLLKLRDGYRSVAAQRYEKQLKATEEQLEQLRTAGQLAEEQYNARMDSLEADYEEKLSKLETYIDKFARIDLSDLDADEQKIIALVQAGEFDEALSIYESQNLSARLKQSREDLSKLTSARDQLAEVAAQKERENERLRASIDRQVTLLRIAGGDENLLKAHHIIYQTFLADTTYFDARKEYAVSLKMFGRNHEAIQTLQFGIASESDMINRCLMMIDLMMLQESEGHVDEALRLSTMCDSIASPHRENNHIVASRILPTCLKTQLNFYINKGPLEAGIQVAERMRREWSVDTLSVSSVSLYSVILRQLNEIYTQCGMHEEALWSAHEAITLGQIGHRRNPWAFDLMNAYAFACPTFVFEGRTAEALNAARCSNELISDLLSKSKLAFNLAMSSSCYFSVVEALTSVNLYPQTDSILQSEAQYKAFDRLIQIDPSKLALANVFKLYKSRVWLNLGRHTEAKALADEAIATLQADEEGEAFLPLFGPDIQARIALAECDYSEAIRQCQLCIDYCKAAYSESQDDWDADNLCRQFLLLAEIHIEAKDKSKAKAAIRQAEKVAPFESNRLYIDQLKAKTK